MINDKLNDKLINIYFKCNPINSNNLIRQENNKAIIENQSGMKQCSSLSFNLIMFDKESMQTLKKAFELGSSIALMTYGQSGSGKTHTLFSSHGIIFSFLSSILANDSTQPIKMIIEFSSQEIYNENVQDILNEHQICRVSDTGEKVDIEGLSKVEIKSVNSLEEILSLVRSKRSTNSTELNSHSSRSHLFISVMIHTQCLNSKIRSQNVIFIDLAGSEKISKTNASKERVQESININKSLTNLGVCLRKIATDHLKTRLPQDKLQLGPNWRNSRLTQLLKNIFTQSGVRIYIIACVSDSNINQTETIETMQFACKLNDIKLSTSHAADNEILTKYYEILNEKEIIQKELEVIKIKNNNNSLAYEFTSQSVKNVNVSTQSNSNDISQKKVLSQNYISNQSKKMTTNQTTDKTADVTVKNKTLDFSNINTDLTNQLRLSNKSHQNDRYSQLEKYAGSNIRNNNANNIVKTKNVSDQQNKTQSHQVEDTLNLSNESEFDMYKKSHSINNIDSIQLDLKNFSMNSPKNKSTKPMLEPITSKYSNEFKQDQNSNYINSREKDLLELKKHQSNHKKEKEYVSIDKISSARQNEQTEENEENTFTCNQTSFLLNQSIDKSFDKMTLFKIFEKFNEIITQFNKPTKIMKVSNNKDIYIRDIQLHYDISNEYSDKNSMSLFQNFNSEKSKSNSNKNQPLESNKDKKCQFFSPLILNKNPKQYLSLLRLKMESKHLFKDKESCIVQFYEIESLNTSMNTFDVNDEDIYDFQSDSYMEIRYMRVNKIKIMKIIFNHSYELKMFQLLIEFCNDLVESNFNKILFNQADLEMQFK